jgi:glycosyltransferase involved in cell wall biosynthesis
MKKRHKMKTGIKIGMASAYFATMKGGGEHYTLHLSNKLADLGYDITIICGKPAFKKPEPLSDSFKIEYVPQLYFLRDLGMRGINFFSGGASLIHYRQYMYSCYRHLLKNHDFDIIHTHDPASLHAAAMIKKKYDIPVVSTFHGHPSSRHIEDVKSVDAVLPVSKEIKSSFEKHGIKNVYDIPGGVDLSHFKPMNKEECKDALGLNGKVILFVGRLIPIKNLYNLLYAFKEVKSMIEDIKLLIVGNGALKGDLTLVAQKLGLNEDVIFAGAISYEKLPTYYNVADAFVLPSIFESFPLVSLEAAACGVPIVISTGADAFIKKFGGDALFVTQPGDPKKISDSLIMVLEDEKKIREKVKISLKRVQLYDWMEKTKKVAAIYEQCLQKAS